MALKPHLWAWDDAPVDNTTAALVLLALADEAADDGTGSCPYMAKMMKRSRSSKRAVQMHLRELFRMRLINNGDPRVAMRRYNKAAGQAPRCWDLNMNATWDNVPTPRTDEEMRAEYSEMIGIRPPRMLSKNGSDTDDAEANGETSPQVNSGVHDVHPSAELGEHDPAPVAEDDRGVHVVHPSAELGKQEIAPQLDGLTGVQPVAPEGCSQLHPRGAASCTLPAFDLSSPEDLSPRSSRNGYEEPQAETISDNSPNAAAESDGGGNSTSSEDPKIEEAGPLPADRDLLNVAVGDVLQVRQGAEGWSQESVVGAMRAALGAGFSARDVAIKMVELADDTLGTRFPGRLVHVLQLGQAKASGTSQSAAGAADERVGAQVLDRAVPRCRKPRHLAQPADGCLMCRTEAEEAAGRYDAHAPLPEEAEDGGLSPAELARRVALRSATGRGAGQRRSRLRGPVSPVVPIEETAAAPEQAGTLFAGMLRGAGR